MKKYAKCVVFWGICRAGNYFTGPPVTTSFNSDPLPNSVYIPLTNKQPCYIHFIYSYTVLNILSASSTKHIICIYDSSTVPSNHFTQHRYLGTSIANVCSTLLESVAIELDWGTLQNIQLIYQ